MQLRIERLGLQGGEARDDAVGIHERHGGGGVGGGAGRGVFGGVGDEAGVGVAEHVVETAFPVGAGEAHALALERIHGARQHEVHLAAQLEQAFAKQQVAAARGRRVAEARAQPRELGVDLRPHRRLALRGEARHRPPRRIHHVAGKHHHRGKLEAPLQPRARRLLLALRREEPAPAAVHGAARRGVEADDLARLPPHRGEVAPAPGEKFHRQRVVFRGVGGRALVGERLG